MAEGKSEKAKMKWRKRMCLALKLK